jgi:hypothetical protein
MRRLGIAEGTIMRIGGWKTRSVFDRYNIIDQRDLTDAASLLNEHQKTMESQFGYSSGIVDAPKQVESTPQSIDKSMRLQ